MLLSRRIRIRQGPFEMPQPRQDARTRPIFVRRAGAPDEPYGNQWGPGPTRTIQVPTACSTTNEHQCLRLQAPSPWISISRAKARRKRRRVLSKWAFLLHESRSTRRGRLLESEVGETIPIFKTLRGLPWHHLETLFHSARGDLNTTVPESPISRLLRWPLSRRNNHLPHFAAP